MTEEHSHQTNIFNPPKNETILVSKFSLTDFSNEILEKILDLVSFDALFNLERVNKRIRKIVLKVAWPRRRRIDHESIIKNTGYPWISYYEFKKNFYCLDKKKQKKFKLHKISTKSVKAILFRSNIQNFDVSMYSLSSEICSLLSMAPQLISLDLSFISLEDADLITIAKSCPLLEKAGFEKCFEKIKCGEGLEAIFSKCPNIKYLNLKQNSNFDGNCFYFLPSELIYLNISDCNNFRENDFELLSIKVKNLETLILPNTTNNNINNLLQNFTKLKYFGLSFIKAWNRPPLVFSNMVNLEKLCLKKNELVTSVTYESLQQCLNLTTLDLSSNYKLDDHGIEILKNCKALKYLNISDCQKITKICDLAKKCQLEYLAIINCRNICQNEIEILIETCDTLTHLEIVGLTIDYDKLLSFIGNLEQPCSKNRNILKIAILKGKMNVISKKWCEFIEYNSTDLPAFPQFVNVHTQFRNY